MNNLEDLAFSVSIIIIAVCAMCAPFMEGV